jgi:transcriptional regulator with XRE-family HTH domain
MTKSFHSEPYADFLAVLVAARQAKGFTQQAVADRLQKPQSYVAKIEGGERRIDIIEFIALARALEIDPSAMFTDTLRAIDSTI